MGEPLCEVCEVRESMAVAAVPGVPYSAAFCRECLVAGAIPYWIAVVNTGLAADRLEDTADWWQEIVNDTLSHLGKSMEEFNVDLVKSIEETPEGPQ